MEHTNFRIQNNCTGVDWDRVVDILKEVGMGTYTTKKHRLAFENSFLVVFVFYKESLVGFGRLLSDGQYQAAVYDVAVDSRYQGCGIGKVIIENLLADLDGVNVMLYASPGKEGFYEKFGFNKAQTGMIRFINQDRMRDLGFI